MRHLNNCAGEPVQIECTDGVRLGGHLWRGAEARTEATVIVNAATGVRASHYGRYAAFLAAHGFDAITYDYRGIGGSRGIGVRKCGARWSDWGTLDFDAVVRFARERRPDLPVFVVGHSVGGALPGLAESAVHVRRILSVGGQFGHWPDYAPWQRRRLFWKWHVAMPLLTAACGYFPGSRLGWLEDLPAGVAFEWAFQRGAIERNHPRRMRAEVLRRFASVTAQVLAVGMSDDPYATPAALRRTLSNYQGSRIEAVMLSPSDVGQEEVGHFGLFHDRHASGFWLDTIGWLRDGSNPWPHRTFPLAPGPEEEGWRRPHIARYY